MLTQNPPPATTKAKAVERKTQGERICHKAGSDDRIIGLVRLTGEEVGRIVVRLGIAQSPEGIASQPGDDADNGRSE